MERAQHAAPPARVLIVDDRSDNLLVLGLSLEPLKLNVVTARSGREALRQLLDHEFAVVVLDVQMPDMDGFETAGMIRQREKTKHTPIIFLTAFDTSEENVFQGYSVGAVDYVFKPFDPEILRSKVAVFVHLFETRRELERQLVETQRLNMELQRANAELARSETALRQAHDELEARVQERTQDLAKANRELHAEVGERLRAELQIKESLHEKEVLLKEVQHRVKNNLQVLASLLNLQSNTIRDPQALDVIRESQNRIRSMALVHEKCYHSKDLARIDFADYIRNLATHLVHAYGTPAITLTTCVDEVILGVETAIPCGLIINELVSNSLKYAFPSGVGEIRIELRTEKDHKFMLRVSDNGVGLPKDMDVDTTPTLGLQLVHTLANQLGALLEMDGQAGAAFKLTFAEPPYTKRC